ncbi:MAG: peptidyl-prolyl cis-trans isomerase [Acidobacteriota bacterium]
MNDLRRPLICLSLTLAGVSGLAAPTTLPVIDGQQAVASVNGEPITLQEFKAEMYSVHAAVEQPNAPIAKRDPADLLTRLINTKLIVQEAERIGLADLPEIAKLLGVFERDALRTALFRRYGEAITVADAATVQRLYKEEVKQLKLRSVLLETEALQRDLSSRLQAGKPFEAAVAEMVTAGRLTHGIDEQSVKPSALLPSIGPAVMKLKPGEVTPPIKLDTKFTIVKLVELVYPDDPAARKQIEQVVLDRQRGTSIENYTASLRQQYTQIDKKLLDSLDFESAKPGFDKLAADKRVLATIKGEDPVTIADLADNLKKKFFHGVDEAVTKKKINIRKGEMLDDILTRRVVIKEARRLKLDQTESFRAEKRDERDGLVFGAFVRKVIDPSLKLEESEVKEFQKAHAKEYSTQAMIRLEYLAFLKRADAEAALAKLRQGADLRWMRANADGQADPVMAGSVFGASGDLLIVETMPEPLKKALTGARPGDFRFYGDAQPPYFALFVKDLVPAAARPYDEVKATIARRLLDEKRTKSVEEWAAKLRAASQVKVFANGEQLTSLLRGEMKTGN